MGNSSFTPARCFRAPQTIESRQKSPEGTTASSASSSSSHGKSSHSRRSSDLFEPASPRVGCMGSVKSTDMTSSGSSASSQSSSSSSGRSAKGRSKVAKIKRALSRPKTRPAYVASLDPPLPVVKKPVKDRKSANLWKRRCGGWSLKHIHLKEEQQQQQQQQPCH